MRPKEWPADDIMGPSYEIYKQWEDRRLKALGSGRDAHESEEQEFQKALDSIDHVEVNGIKYFGPRS